LRHYFFEAVSVETIFIDYSKIKQKMEKTKILISKKLNAEKTYRIDISC